MRPLQDGQRRAREPEPRERHRGGRGRLVADDRERGESDGVDLEGAPAGPGQRSGKLGQTIPGRDGEPVVGVEQAKSSGAPEPDEDDSGLRLVQDPPELGGEPLAR